MIKKIATKLVIIAAMLAAAPIYAAEKEPTSAATVKDCMWFPNDTGVVDFKEVAALRYRSGNTMAIFEGDFVGFATTHEEFLKLRQEFVYCRRPGQVPLFPKNK